MIQPLTRDVAMNGAMDPTKVIYAAAASSTLDSWDFENLHYIRKISRSQLPFAHVNHHEPVSYISEQTEGPESMSLPPVLGGDEEDDHEMDNKEEGMIVAGTLLEGTMRGTMTESSKSNHGLDDCYLLDVVTVRNESVMAFSSHSYPVDKKGGSLSSPSPPSEASSASSSGPFQGFLLARPPPGPRVNLHERDFFDMSLETRSMRSEASLVPTLLRRHSGCLLDGPSVSTTVINMQRLQLNTNSIAEEEGTCPFCHQNPEFYLEDHEPEGHLEDVSMQVTVGEEPPTVPPRSPSPYYIRLRRDLLTAIATPARNSKMNPPRNFTVNTQGQLAIDYSSNWRGLENYVRNKRR